MTSTTESFKHHWNHIHEMTTTFVAAVPDTAWDASPHPGFAPFSKQLRHIVCVRGVYNQGLASGQTDFSRKHDYYTGTLTREALVSGLEEKQTSLMKILEDVDWLDAPGLAVYSYVMVQHEAIHHGQWSLYAAQSGFPVPPLWTLEWGLGPWTRA